jgi:hypothetical protein
MLEQFSVLVFEIVYGNRALKNMLCLLRYFLGKRNNNVLTLHFSVDKQEINHGDL